MRVPIRRRFGRVQCEKRMVSSVSPAVLCGAYFCATLAHPLAVQSFQNIGHIDFKNDRCLLLSPNGRHGICMICFEAHASCVGYHVLLLYTDVIFFHLVTRQVKIQTYCRSSSDGCVKSCCGFRVLDVSKWATIFVKACFAVASCCPLICMQPTQQPLAAKTTFVVHECPHESVRTRFILYKNNCVPSR